jgi:hypothetical protein
MLSNAALQKHTLLSSWLFSRTREACEDAWLSSSTTASSHCQHTSAYARSPLVRQRLHTVSIRQHTHALL